MSYRTPHATFQAMEDLGEANPAQPSRKPTPQQYELARRYVLREAPDLMDALFGGAL